MTFFGPARSVAGPSQPLDWAMFLGDETAVGLAVALLEALPAGTRVLGAIESDVSDAPAVAAFGLPLASACRGPHHGAALTGWLDGVELPAGRGTVWLSGEASSVLTLRNALLERGLRRDHLVMKPYWSVKGHAHRKSLSRQL